MTRLRKIGLVSLAVLIISVIVSQVAFADYVDASKNNDKLPKQYDYSLFKTGGYSVVDGYEDKAKQGRRHSMARVSPADQLRPKRCWMDGLGRMDLRRR